MLKKTILLIAGVAGLAPGTAAAIPAFARMHRVSCSACHDPAPRLNAFGENFVSNGYRFSPNQPVPDAEPTGDPLLELPRVLRLAMRVDAYASAYTGGDPMADFQTPYNVKVMSGGPLSRSFSYYTYFMLSERGATGGIEDAFLTWNRAAGLPVTLQVGQFQVSDPMFPREVRLEYQDFVIYRARIGHTSTDLTYDRGLMIRADLAGFTMTGEIINGNGSPGAADNRRFDDDHHKAFLGHVSRDLGGGLMLGALGYWTRQDGAAAGNASTTNELWMLGTNAAFSRGPLELRGQFLHREDSDPTFTAGEPKAVTNGGFGEALWHPVGQRWYGLGLVNVVHTSRPLLDARLGGAGGLTRYEAITLGGGYLVRRNLRAHGEATWDREQDSGQLSAGLMIAF